MSNSPSSEQLTPAAAPQQAGEAAATSEDDYIRLKKSELSNEIRRLQLEDKEFLQVYNSHVGDHAKRKWEPEIRSRDARITELQTELRRREIMAMDEEDIEKQFETDENFAIEYAKLIHSNKPKPDAPIDETPVILDAWNAMTEWALSKGIPQTKIDEVTDKAARGMYSSDGSHWSVSLQRVQNELTDTLVGQAKAPAPAASTVNPNLAKRGPDLTNGQHAPSTNYRFKNVAEFKALPIAEQRAILKTPDGMEYVENLAKKG